MLFLTPDAFAVSGVSLWSNGNKVRLLKDRAVCKLLRRSSVPNSERDHGHFLLQLDLFARKVLEV